MDDDIPPNIPRTLPCPTCGKPSKLSGFAYECEGFNYIVAGGTPIVDGGAFRGYTQARTDRSWHKFTTNETESAKAAYLQHREQQLCAAERYSDLPPRFGPATLGTERQLFEQALIRIGRRGLGYPIMRFIEVRYTIRNLWRATHKWAEEKWDGPVISETGIWLWQLPTYSDRGKKWLTITENGELHYFALDSTRIVGVPQLRRATNGPDYTLRVAIDADAPPPDLRPAPDRTSSTRHSVSLNVPIYREEHNYGHHSSMHIDWTTLRQTTT